MPTRPSRSIWTKPEDLNVDGVDAKQAVYGTRKEVSFVPSPTGPTGLDPEITADLVHALLTRNGGEVVNLPPTDR